MKKTTKIAFSVTVIFVVLLLTAVVGLFAPSGFSLNDNHREGFRVFYSPDNQYRLVVKSKGASFFSLPGQGSDGAGIIILKDNKTNRILKKTDIPIKNALNESDIRWSINEVDIKLVAPWSLPSPIRVSM